MSAPGGRDWRRFLCRLLIVAVAVIFLVSIGREAVIFWLNVVEFGDLFLKPIYFGFLGGIILSTLAFFRVDFLGRRSIILWLVRLVIRLIKAGGDWEKISPIWFDFYNFRLSPTRFIMWQVTKTLVGSVFFTNVIFGMAVDASLKGWRSGVDALPRIFLLPFITPPFNGAFVEKNVIPAIPFLTLLLSPLLRALWIRLILLVVATHAIRILMPYVVAYLWDLDTPNPVKFAPSFQALCGVLLLWFTSNAFFSSFIDYNTRYWISGLAAAGFVFIIFAVIDWFKRSWSSGSAGPSRRSIAIRLGTVLLILMITGSLMAVNNSIANARKLDMLGPYITQHVYLNRYLAELDKIQEAPYRFGLTTISPDKIDEYVAENTRLLSEVRLWDWEAAFDKLKPQIGLIPYIDFSDSDIIHFNNTLYWSASMKPILPETVTPADRWYAMHLVYTHVPNGFLMLNGHDGRIVDAASFFKQRRIYYGEGGLFKETWIAFPVNRKESAEVDGYFYNGSGGVNVPPPLSWFFEPNFLMSYPTTTMRIIRYRDIFDRMKLLFPYFTYRIGGKHIDVWPVSDGRRTFWAMPLIVFLGTGNVPWSDGNPLGRLVGYALIDAYNGNISLIILGDDYFSQLFKKVYSKYISTTVPEWLKTQLRYPEELFEWRVNMYNFFHVKDAGTFIAAKEFYTVPKGLDTYYVIAKPPGFKKEEFIGMLSLELRGGKGKNLAGYMIVRNNYPHTGEMIFYEVPLESKVKLLGPTAVREALLKNPDFAKLRTLLRNPRIGNQIFYNIGNFNVYFIPIYTAPGGGVVTQIGTIATVGADFTGEYYVGLGPTIEESFRAFLAKIAGVEAPPATPKLSAEERIEKMIKVFEEAGLKVLKPVTVNPDVSFLEGTARYVSENNWNDTLSLINSLINLSEKYDTSRVFMWMEDGKVNFGILVNVENVLELHYITVELA